MFFLSALFFFLLQLRVVCYFKYLIIVSSFPISFRHILTRKTPLDINVTCSKEKKNEKKRQNRGESESQVALGADAGVDDELKTRLRMRMRMR